MFASMLSIVIAKSGCDY